MERVRDRWGERGRMERDREWERVIEIRVEEWRGREIRERVKHN